MQPVIKPRNSGTWTEARFRSFIVSALRRTSSRWGPKNAAKINARYFEKLPNDRGRLVFHSICAHCDQLVPETTSSVDHIHPVVNPEKGFTTWDDYIGRMFCEAIGFQTLCTSCHKTKTKGERDLATERKRRERILTQ